MRRKPSLKLSCEKEADPDVYFRPKPIKGKLQHLLVTVTLYPKKVIRLKAELQQSEERRGITDSRRCDAENKLRACRIELCEMEEKEEENVAMIDPRALTLTATPMGGKVAT